MLRVAVVTPYFKEPLELLRQCHLSVARQTYPCLHVMVADGFPQAALDGWQIDHLTLPRPHGDIGSTPRLVGCYHAIGLGFDAVAFLDADNWYREDHVETLVRLHERTGAASCRPAGCSAASTDR
ncbi:MAG: glycosyltransferase [Caulobacteraceae bacterium]